MFKREEIRSYYIHDTQIENVFINEFLPDAPGNHVKVFLFALMYADIGASIGNEDIAKQLSLNIEDVLSAWTYWEEKGIIRKEYSDRKNKLQYNVTFVNLKEKMFGIECRSTKQDQEEKHLPSSMDDKDLKELYKAIEQITRGILSGQELLTILSWIEDYEVSKEYILYAYQYAKKERSNTKVNYVGAIIKDWILAGLRTIEEIEDYLEENDNRRYQYKRVMKALGFMRNPTEEEKRIMDVWFDDLSLSIHDVLEACKKTSGISNPNINYVNAVLTSPKKQGGSRQGRGQSATSSGRLISLVMKSYEEDRKAGEEIAEKRREEIYKKIPKIKEIEEEIRRSSMEITRLMLSRRPGFEEEIEKIKKHQENLLNEKAYQLTENNYQIDFLDTPYTCSLCKDEGVLENGARCSCFSEKLKQQTKTLKKE